MTTAQLSQLSATELDNLEQLTQDLTTMIDEDTLTHEYATDVISESLVNETIELTEMLLTAIEDSEKTGIGAYLIDRHRRHERIMHYGYSTVADLKRYIRPYRTPKSKWRKHELILAFMHLECTSLEETGITHILRQPIE